MAKVINTKKCAISILFNDLQYLSEKRIGQSEMLRAAIAAHKENKFIVPTKKYK